MFYAQTCFVHCSWNVETDKKTICTESLVVKMITYLTEAQYQGWHRLQRIVTHSCTQPASKRPPRFCIVSSHVSSSIHELFSLPSFFLSYPRSFQVDNASHNRFLTICVPRNQSAFSLSSSSILFSLPPFAIPPHSSSLPFTGSSTPPSKPYLSYMIRSYKKKKKFSFITYMKMTTKIVFALIISGL